MALAPVKVVLKSTTTKTLSERFTEMMQSKSRGNRQTFREENITANRASAKNRRLAEQMSRRPGVSTSSVMDREEKKQVRKGNVKNRIDQSSVNKVNVKDRLGITNSRGGSQRGGSRGGRRGGSIQNRLGSTNSFGARGGGTRRGNRGGRGGLRGRPNNVRGGRKMNSSFNSSQSSSNLNRSRNNINSKRGRGGNSGRGGRGRGRGRGGGRGGRNRAPNKDNLDSELESYMSSK